MGPPVPGPAPGRLRLRPWLEQQIHSGLYPGVSWLDQTGGVFQIPWKHAARHGWSIDRDASLFRSWAMYTGRYVPGRDKPDPKTWKANFRCALNSLPDVKELREQSMKRGSLASRVYRLLPPRAPGRRRRGQQGGEAAPVRQVPESRVPLDRFSEAFCRSRGFPGRLCEEGVCYGLLQSRDRASLPPYGRVKQEEGATAEQHSYSASFLQLLPQTSSCTPHTHDMWDSSTDEQEQTEAVYKIVDHLSTTDLWGQSGDHPGWRPASSSHWEDCYCGDVDSLACPLQTHSYGPPGPIRPALEDYTMGLAQ